MPQSDQTKLLALNQPFSQKLRRSSQATCKTPVGDAVLLKALDAETMASARSEFAASAGDAAVPAADASGHPASTTTRQSSSCRRPRRQGRRVLRVASGGTVCTDCSYIGAYPSYCQLAANICCKQELQDGILVHTADDVDCPAHAWSTSRQLRCTCWPHGPIHQEPGVVDGGKTPFQRSVFDFGWALNWDC